MHRRYLPENKLSKNKIRTPISKCHRGQVHEVYAAKSCVCLATELEADVSFFFHMLTLFFISQVSIPRKIHLLSCPLFWLIISNSKSTEHF